MSPRRRLLLLACGLHLLAATFLAVDGPDRVGGSAVVGPFDGTAYPLLLVLGAPALAALAAARHRRAVLALGVLGVAVAVLLLPLYGLGLLLLPGAVVALAAGARRA